MMPITTLEMVHGFEVPHEFSLDRTGINRAVEIEKASNDFVILLTFSKIFQKFYIPAVNCISIHYHLQIR